MQACCVEPNLPQLGGIRKAEIGTHDMARQTRSWRGSITVLTSGALATAIQTIGIGNALPQNVTPTAGSTIPSGTIGGSVNPLSMSTAALDVYCKIVDPDFPPKSPRDPLPAMKSVTLVEASQALGVISRASGVKTPCPRRGPAPKRALDLIRNLEEGLPGTSPHTPLAGRVTEVEFNLTSTSIQKLFNGMKTVGPSK